MTLRTAITTLAAMVAFTSTGYSAELYKVVKDKSKVDFVGTKTDGKHAGGFKTVTGDAKVDFEKPENGSIKIVVETASIWSDDPKLTEHLKNADFFDIRQHPTITFESIKVESNQEGEATIVGKLTLLGKTVETKIPAKASVENEQIKLNAKFKIDRTAFGMKYGEGKINKDVEIEANIVLAK